MKNLFTFVVNNIGIVGLYLLYISIILTLLNLIGPLIRPLYIQFLTLISILCVFFQVKSQSKRQ